MHPEHHPEQQPATPTSTPLLARLRHLFERHRPAHPQQHAVQSPSEQPQPEHTTSPQHTLPKETPRPDKLTETPPAETPPAETPPAETPPAETPPAETQHKETQHKETQHKETQIAEPLPEPTPLPDAKPSESPPAEPAQPPQTSTARPVLLHDDARDVEKLAETITAAFANDPFIKYLHGSHPCHAYEKELIANRTLLRCELSRPKGQTTIHVTDDNNCVAIWHQPGHWKITGWYLARFMLTMLRAFGWRAFALNSMMKEVERVHPEQPHMHLFIIATHTDHQGKGYGTTVMSEMLKHCDRERLPAYLESSNQRNLSFYRRHGFDLIQQIQPSRPGCPPIFTMWREPRPIEKQ